MAAYGLRVSKATGAILGAYVCQVDADLDKQFDPATETMIQVSHDDPRMESQAGWRYNGGWWTYTAPPPSQPRLDLMERRALRQINKLRAQMNPLLPPLTEDEWLSEAS